MPICVSLEQLELLLDEGLDGPAESEVAAHVEGCLACQKRLDVITRRPLGGILGLLPAVKMAGFLGEAPRGEPAPPDQARASNDLSPTSCSDDQASPDGSDG